MTTLRLISFNLDYHWSKQKRRYQRRPVNQMDDQRREINQMDMINNCGHTLRDLTEIHHPSSDYNYFAFLAYVLYLPLYVAGPILSFNAFLAQLKRPQVAIGVKSSFKHLFRICCYAVMLEFFQHMFVGLVSISQYRLFHRHQLVHDLPAWEVVVMGW
eukprot:CAMPEP_0198347784 /NCGR_PEP_ID=MMETSP1450-20131203/86753_1 /TAXON_ID=753684 ORGANISM="Madagascaria erythrocladiodes, Strain CCMP3234" /NCGR_SAMPLE_ID=MMETSP1450 /ASSEMBLY_ACC=CAM_ASM_001115 /LENGTH=157 /DNA_ID=CAMNT_0044053345 /DNA_START=140 /DNA_END=610 /DNA_ORIENTATION=+